MSGEQLRQRRVRAAFLRWGDTWYNQKLKNGRLWPSELREGGEDGDEMQEGPVRWQRTLQARGRNVNGIYCTLKPKNGHKEARGWGGITGWLSILMQLSVSVSGVDSSRETISRSLGCQEQSCGFGRVRSADSTNWTNPSSHVGSTNGKNLKNHTLVLKERE